MSIITSALLLAYFFYKVKIMIFYEADTISLSTTDTDYEDLGERRLNDMGVMFYFFA